MSRAWEKANNVLVSQITFFFFEVFFFSPSINRFLLSAFVFFKNFERPLNKLLRRSSLPTPSPAGLPICENIWTSLQSSWCRIIHGISLLCNISTLERRVGRSKGSGSNFSRNNPLFGFKSSIDARSPHRIKSSQNNGFVGLCVYLHNVDCTK